MPLFGHHPLIKLIICELAQGGRTGEDLHDLLLERISDDASLRELLTSIEGGNLFRFLNSMQKHGLLVCLNRVYYLEAGVQVEQYLDHGEKTE